MKEIQIFENKLNKNTLDKVLGFYEIFGSCNMGKDKIFTIGGYTYSLHRYAPYGTKENIFITDITNAGKKGKICVCIKLEFDIKSDFVDWLLNNDFDDVFFHLVADDNFDGVTKYVCRLDAKRVYNPLTLKEIYKPLKAEPNKWNVRNVIQALVNGQFIDLKCDGKYTDDYAYDNAVNFNRGAINPTYFIRDLIENAKYGWRASKYDKRVNIDCHSFDTNSFIFVL